MPEVRFLVVIGNSESGKFSLVEAGVLSRLEKRNGFCRKYPAGVNKSHFVINSTQPMHRTILRETDHLPWSFSSDLSSA